MPGPSRSGGRAVCPSESATPCTVGSTISSATFIRGGAATANAIASAMCSAGVKLGYSLPGFFSRIAGVRIALTTTMLAVAPVPANESASASVQVSAAALVDA